MDGVLPLRCVDDTMKGTALGEWCSMLIEGAAKLGKDWTCTSKFQQWMIDAGFVDVHLEPFSWPTNSWAKSPDRKILGKWFEQDLLDGVSAMSMATLTRGLRMSPEEVELLLVEVRNDIKDRRIHAFFPM